MTTIQFLMEWALRSSILILSGALLLWALRVLGLSRAKDSSIRLAAWTTMLFGSLAIPALSVVLPKVVLFTVTEAVPIRTEAPVAASGHSPEALPTAFRSVPQVPKTFDWTRAALAMYVLVALALLLRLCVGLAMSVRLLRGSRATDRASEGIEIRESDRVAAPVTLGIMRPAIVLPADWRQWEGAKLEAVLAHERSHIRRHDPALQLLSAIHRVLLWHSPLSWFLHRRIVRVAEEASDDAAVMVTGDHALYAEVLLDFMQRGGRGANGWGVPMARYGRAEDRINRILDSTLAQSRGITRWSVAAILAFGSPLAYLAAAASQESAPQTRTESLRRDATETPVSPVPAGKSVLQTVAQSRTQVQVGARPAADPVYLTGLGSVTAFYTVVVKPRVDGQLMRVSFREGEMVQGGQLLASIDPGPYQIELAQAEGQLVRDQAQQLEASIKNDQANIESARLRLTYTQIRAPITGVTGLRLVDPGNMVHADAAIVIITQLQPIAVLFTIPEDSLPAARAHLKEGEGVLVEAWNRDNSVKLAIGRLTAVDNQIDVTTGTAKLKAVFDNKDEALFPNQFVNVRMLVKGR
jgi:multidrug efflux pump subunit AcrA (membrane-fusion protein)